MKVFRLQKSMCGVLLCVPHAGTFVPREYAATMTEAGLATRENWFLMEKADQSGLQSCGLIASNISRHVVDLDCDPSLADVCPLKTVRGKVIYLEEQEPDSKQIQQRIDHYWQPFYDQLNDELTRMVEQFGKATVVILRSGKDARLAGSRTSWLENAIGKHARVKVEDLVLFTDTDPQQIEAIAKKHF